MRYVYTVIYCLCTPYLLLRLWWKGFKAPAYKHRIGERFGIYAITVAPVEIWLHLVSLGEVISALPLITKLLEQNKKLLITTTTPTGSAKLTQHFSNRICHCYLPYELPIVLKRFFKMFQPQIGIIFETELWPNLLYYAKKSQVKLLLFNACLSLESLQKYLKIKSCMREILDNFDGIYTQTLIDSERFQALGAISSRVHIIGNLKFDLIIPTIDVEKLAACKQIFGEDRKILLIASTHNNEEQQILSVLSTLQQQIPNLLLLIAPRHPERFMRVYHLSQSLGFKTLLFTEEQTTVAEVVIIDILGELLQFYALSNYAIVGGSFVPVGGHNILEPIAMRTSVFIGPYIANITTICQPFFDTEVIIQVQNMMELVEKLVKFNNEMNATEYTNLAYNILCKHQGVLQLYLKIINDVIVHT